MPSLLRHRERGTAAVEMAIVLPVLLFVTAAIIDFGRAFNAQILLSNASREGARMIAMGYSSSEADTRIGQALTGSGLTPNKVYVSCPGAPTASQAGSATLTLPTSGPGAFKWVVLDQVSLLFGSAVPTPTISSTGSMRCGG
jgi:hypothetical protein